MNDKPKEENETAITPTDALIAAMESVSDCSQIVIVGRRASSPNIFFFGSNQRLSEALFLLEQFKPWLLNGNNGNNE